MTKKKRSRPSVEDIIARPWCYYCERDFDDLKILIQHQKAKHFKCDTCGRRLNTAGGLSVHLSQVHKETLSHIDNALEHRKDAGIEIFGMEGIPVETSDAHRLRVVDEFYKEQNSRRAETGNPPPGAGGKAPQAAAVKKAKVVETPGSLKERLAAHRAKREAERQGIRPDRGSGANTPDPMPDVQSHSPAHAPAHPQPSETTNDLNGVKPYPAPPGWPPGYPAHAFWGSEGQAMPGRPPFPPLTHGLVALTTSPYRPLGMAPTWQPQSASPVQSLPQTAPPSRSLPPPVPGLPARPTFELPQPKQSDYHRMHHGRGAPQDFAQQLPEASRQEVPSQSTEPLDQSIIELIASAKAENERLSQANAARVRATDNTLNPAASESTTHNGENAGVKLAASHHNEHEMADAGTAPTQPTTSKKDGKEKKKKDKKSKDAQNLVYSDNRTSPEEKMASFPRYHFELQDRTRFILDEAGGAVTGVNVDQDTVLDAQNSH